MKLPVSAFVHHLICYNQTVNVTHGMQAKIVLDVTTNSVVLMETLTGKAASASTTKDYMETSVCISVYFLFLFI